MTNKEDKFTIRKKCTACRCNFSFAKKDIKNKEMEIRKYSHEEGFFYPRAHYNIYLINCDIIECSACGNICVLKEKDRIRIISSYSEGAYTN